MEIGMPDAYRPFPKLPKRRAMGRAEELDWFQMPELDGLDLPWVHEGDEYGIHDGSELWGANGGDPVTWHDYHGRPITGPRLVQMRTYGALRTAREAHRRSFFYRQGIEIRVSTVYLGIDHQFRAGLPRLVWETMVFVGGSGEERGQWRYASPRAARHGHLIVADVIRQAQRARRRREAVTPPRRRALTPV